MKALILFLSLIWSNFFGEEPRIYEKVLICGICKSVEGAVPNTIRSVEELGGRFEDYRVIIYENNSTDRTKELMGEWAKKEPRVIFLSEQLSGRKIVKELSMGVANRTEQIARARNIVLDVAMGKKYDDFKYVIWADLDFVEPWDIKGIVETILHPEQEWDAVFANGAYDLFALRSPEVPIGFELVGDLYWKKLAEIEKHFVFDEKGPWKKVYSAFGGLGIYKREALKGCRYSGVVTEDLEHVVEQWLVKAREGKEVCLFKEYEALLTATTPIRLSGTPLAKREKYPEEIGVQLMKGSVVWFSCTKKATLPWTCEHIPLHASMERQGRGRFFVNPKLHRSR